MDKINKGRKMLIVLIVLALLIDIFTIGLVSSIYAVNGDMDRASFKLLQGIMRLILTLIIMFFLYKGHRWAKWLLIVLSALAGLLAFLSLNLTFNLLTLIQGVIWLAFFIGLTQSKSIKNFLLYQRKVINSNIVEDTSKEKQESADTPW